MNLRSKAAVVLLIALTAGATAAARDAGTPPPEDAVTRAENAISDWPPASQELAAAIMQEYGAPNKIRSSRLTWTGKGLWNRIVVLRAGASTHGSDALQQSVVYDMPLLRWRRLTAFGHGVSYDAFDRELTARADSEPENFLALNLADEVVRGLRTPEQASAFYAKTVSLSFSGKSSPYMSGLLFRPGLHADVLLDTDPE